MPGVGCSIWLRRKNNMNFPQGVLSVRDVAATLFNFTISEETYEPTLNRLRDIDELDLERVRAELIFITVVIVDIVLRSQLIHEIHGPQADHIFPRYLNCFKEQTTVTGADGAFIHLLNERGNVYLPIIQNDNRSSPELNSLMLADAIAKYCGVTDPAPTFYLVMTHDFGSIMDNVGKFLEKIRLN
jgi:hypothetical protein